NARGPTRGPGGQPPRGGGGNLGGGRGSGEPPDLEELLQASRQRLKRAFPQRGGRSGGGGAPGIELNPRTFGLGLAGLALLWGLAGIYQIGPTYQGVKTTFGKYSGISGPGLHWRAPLIQGVTKVGVEDQRTAVIDGGDSQNLMLTSDRNIVDVSFTVNWKIKAEPPEPGQLPNAAKFVFNIEDPDSLIRNVAESAMRETIGAKQLEPILTSGQAEVVSQTTRRIQEVLDSYDSGMEVIRVNMERPDVPGSVRDAFADVIKARNEKTQMINEAERTANQIVPVAEGDAQRMVEEARAYAARVESEAIGEAERFNKIFEEYRRAKDVTKQRMYLETMEQVLGPMNKVMIDDQAGKGVVPYLPLDQLTRPKSATPPQ
ncbi:MAG: FtsH protease activity modulator HflK, partial [Parvularculaceae bacterium]|nr:FtsH protease activity modulator HflK [Parvularculaceae bacterium]